MDRQRQRQRGAEPSVRSSSAGARAGRGFLGGNDAHRVPHRSIIINKSAGKTTGPVRHVSRSAPGAHRPARTPRTQPVPAARCTPATHPPFSARIVSFLADLPAAAPKRSRERVLWFHDSRCQRCLRIPKHARGGLSISLVMLLQCGRSLDLGAAGTLIFVVVTQRSNSTWRTCAAAICSVVTSLLPRVHGRCLVPPRPPGDVKTKTLRNAHMHTMMHACARPMNGRGDRPR